MAVPPGARDHVLEAAGVLAGLEQQLGRAEDRLRREQQRRVAVEADLHAAVGERLDDEHHVRRAAPEEAGDGVEQRLVEDDDAAHRLEELARDAQVVRAARALPPAIAVAPACTVAGVFGIARTTRDPARQARLERLDGHAGGDRDDELVGAHVAADLGEHLVDDLRLDREDEDVRLAQERVVVGRRADAVRARASCSRRSAFTSLARMRSGGQHLGVREALDERRRHVARAEEAESSASSLQRPRHARERLASTSARRAPRRCGSSSPRSSARRSHARAEQRAPPELGSSASAAAQATPSTARRSSASRPT